MFTVAWVAHCGNPFVKESFRCLVEQLNNFQLSKARHIYTVSPWERGLVAWMCFSIQTENNVESNVIVWVIWHVTPENVLLPSSPKYTYILSIRVYIVEIGSSPRGFSELMLK